MSDRSHHLKKLMKEPINRRNILSLKTFEKLDQTNKNMVFLDSKLQFYGTAIKHAPPIHPVTVNANYSHVTLQPNDTTMPPIIISRGHSSGANSYVNAYTDR